MEDFVLYSELYDIYGELLTSKQKEYFEDYYFNNLSFSEMADQYKVSRNAVFKQVHIVTDRLLEYERVLTFRKGNKFYSVMTDNTRDEKGDLNTYAYCIGEGETSLRPVEDEKELEMVTTIFNMVQEEC